MMAKRKAEQDRARPHVPASVSSRALWELQAHGELSRGRRYNSKKRKRAGAWLLAEKKWKHFREWFLLSKNVHVKIFFFNK